MTSGVKIAEHNIESEWSWYINSWWSTVDFLLYVFIAILFFSFGKNWANFKQKMIERSREKNGMGSYRYAKHTKLKTDEPDEEGLSTNDLYDSRQIKQELQDAKSEVKQLSDELRRLRTRESSLDAENQILKSKLMQDQHDSYVNKDYDTPQYSQNIPKLAAPDSGNGSAQNVNNNYDYSNTQNNGYDNTYYDNSTNQYDYNYNQGYNQEHVQPVGADEQAINDIDQFLDEDD